MSAVSILNEIARMLETPEASSIEVNEKIEALWDEVQTYPDFEKYLYRGKVYVSYLKLENDTRSVDEIIKDCKDFGLVTTNPMVAEAITQVLLANAMIRSPRPQRSHIFCGNTFCGINVNAIIANSKERCVWDFMKAAPAGDGYLVFAKPNSINGLHLYR